MGMCESVSSAYCLHSPLTVETVPIWSDGGNITVISRATDATPSASGEIPGNYERVASILRRHTAFRHLFSRYPFIRPFSKLAARLVEQRSVRSHRPAKEVLDALISDALRPSNRCA